MVHLFINRVHLFNIDPRVVEQMKQAHGITERLKAENQMEWVARMNNLQSCAREIVDKEMIYQ